MARSFVVHLAAVRREQLRTTFLVELVVDREVRKIEERVAHARVLPVDDPQPLAVVDEVGVEEVVVACPALHARSHGGDPARALVGGRKRGGQGRAALARRVPIGLDDVERLEAAGNRPALVERSECGGDPRELVGLAEPLGGRDLAFDELRHEPAFRLYEADDARAHPGLGRGERRGVLDLAIDPQQTGLPARHPDHDDAVGAVDLEVVVRDAAAEDLPRRDAARPDARNGRGQRFGHARIRSPRGSKSGSAATMPFTHSPKISTATSVPTSCSAGRYAYAIDEPMV